MNLVAVFVVAFSKHLDEAPSDHLVSQNLNLVYDALIENRFFSFISVSLEFYNTPAAGNSHPFDKDSIYDYLKCSGNEASFTSPGGGSIIVDSLSIEFIVGTIDRSEC